MTLTQKVLITASKGLKIDLTPAEKMNYDSNGLIIIIGSLEHVFDPNIEQCWKLLHEWHLIIEGRYYPISESFRWLNSNHHRFFTNESAQAIFIKHGFKILKSTTDLVCGGNTGRNGAGFAFGMKNSKNKKFLDSTNNIFSELLISKLKIENLIKSPEEIINKINSHDKNFDIKFS